MIYTTYLLMQNNISMPAVAKMQTIKKCATRKNHDVKNFEITLSRKKCIGMGKEYVTM